MNKIINSVMPGNAYQKNAYSKQKSNPQAQERLEPGQQSHFARTFNGRDNLTISDEARRMQHLKETLQIDESYRGQQNGIYRPGRQELKIRSERGIEPVEEPRTHEKRNEPPENTTRDEFPEANEVNRPQEPELEDLNEISPVTREQESLEEAEGRNPDREDMRTVEASIDRFNTSSQVQAYATAASVTQASFLVNYKV